jgi:hypothetical protein
LMPRSLSVNFMPEDVDPSTGVPGRSGPIRYVDYWPSRGVIAANLETPVI